jgi:hypothetical protein
MVERGQAGIKWARVQGERVWKASEAGFVEGGVASGAWHEVISNQ